MFISLHAIVFTVVSAIWFVFFVPRKESGYGPDMMPVLRVILWIIAFLIYAGIYLW